LLGPENIKVVSSPGDHLSILHPPHCARLATLINETLINSEKPTKLMPLNSGRRGTLVNVSSANSINLDMISPKPKNLLKPLHEVSFAALSALSVPSIPYVYNNHNAERTSKC
jgi:hypothetical protein